MSATVSSGSDDPSLLVDDAVALTGRWVAEAARVETGRERRVARRLHQLVDDPAGLAFAMQFVDRVIRPEQSDVAALQLRSLGASAAHAGFLSASDRLLFRAGAQLAPRLPNLVMPLARRRMRQLVGHLVLDADSRRLAEHLARRRRDGFSLNVNLLGEAVLGEREADRRLQATIELLGNEDVDYVSVKISGIAPQLNPWAFDQSIDRIAERLRVVLRAAAETDTFVNLDMEEYHDLELTTAAFRRVLDEDEFAATRAGIVLQAYLPDSFLVLRDLVDWATHRAERGGGEIKLRLVKGANLAMERVDAAMHGWEQAPYASKEETDANYKRCLDWVVRPDRVGAVRIGVASHNLFDLAWAHLLAAERGVADRVGIEMLEGMASAQARVIAAEAGTVLLYTPVVGRRDFDVAISYLFRRLEENAATGNFLRVANQLRPGTAAFDREADAFRASVAHRLDVHAVPRRTIDRSAQVEPVGDGPFENEPESDPAVPGTRRWALATIGDGPGPTVSAVPTSVADVDDLLAAGRRAQREWWSRPPEARRATLRAVADRLAARRGDLLRAMVHEGRKTIGQADPEICEAIDFARYYADRVLELDAPDARFDPLGVVAVIPPWNFPVAIPTGGMLASLAAGNAVIVKPAPEVVRCSEIVVAAAREAGMPADLLQCSPVPENDLGRHLVVSADAVVLTGGIDTARLFQSWRSDLRLFAETSGKNALVITPNADLDLAVRDLVASAFGHAGQKCSAASLAICIGGVADSARFRRQLVDAVESLAVGPSTDPAATIGPLIGAPNVRLARAFATLDAGESWLVRPRCIDPERDVWTPGVRLGVRPGSWFQRTECFGPVLGIIRAASLEEAIAIQNSSEFGLTGGIHTLDPAEAATWADRVEVGNAYVNRVITGAIVRRQPFGGWKWSSVGPGAKAGGPNYVAQLGTWHATGPLDAARWQESDRRAWAEEFGRDHDPTGLFCESDVFRYRPLPRVAARFEIDDPAARARVLDAARCCGVPVIESVAAVETAAAFADRLAGLGVSRVRVVGPVDEDLRRRANELGVHLAADPVTGEGRLELRHYLREQSVSTTLHRFGNLVGVDR